MNSENAPNPTSELQDDLLSVEPSDPADEAVQTVVSLLTPPKRRSVKAMEEFFADLDAGTMIQAVIRCDVFGVYAISGRAQFSEVANGFRFGANILTLGAKPDKSVLSVAAIASSPAMEGNWAHGETLDKPEHGDLVEATFRCRYTGESIAVVGLAVESTAGPMMGVGNWIISSRGVAAPALTALRILAPADQISLACPASLRSWAEVDDLVTE